jgi:hypothetical protein
MSTLDGATAPPEPNVMCATPGEFAARWNAATEELRAQWLRAMQESSFSAEHCRLMHRPPPPIGSRRAGVAPLDPRIADERDYDGTPAVPLTPCAHVDQQPGGGFRASVDGVAYGVPAADFAEGCAEALLAVADEQRAADG